MVSCWERAWKSWCLLRVLTTKVGEGQKELLCVCGSRESSLKSNNQTPGEKQVDSCSILWIRSRTSMDSFKVHYGFFISSLSSSRVCRNSGNRWLIETCANRNRNRVCTILTSLKVTKWTDAFCLFSFKSGVESEDNVASGPLSLLSQQGWRTRPRYTKQPLVDGFTPEESVSESIWNHQSECVGF